METVKLSEEGEILIRKEILEGTLYPPGTEFFLSTLSTGLLLRPKVNRQPKPTPATTREEIRGFLARVNKKNDIPAAIEQGIKAKLGADDDATRE